MSTPSITVDLAAPEPPYEQLRRQIAGHIATGALRTGDRLPTIRALAGTLGLAGNTVARAYKELEITGLIATRRRTGTVVTASGPVPPDAVRDAASHYVRLARQHGLSEGEMVDLVRGAHQQLDS